MYQKPRNYLVKHFDFLCIDGICLILVMSLCLYLRNGRFLMADYRLHTNLILFLETMNLLIGMGMESYRGIRRRGYWREFLAVVKHVSLVMICLVLFLFITKQGELYSRAVLVGQWILGILITYGIHVWHKHNLQQHKGYIRRNNMLVICSRKDAEEILTSLRECKYERIHVSGVILAEESAQDKYIQGVPVLGAGWEDCMSYLEHEWVDEVFIKLPAEVERVDELLDQCALMGITTHITLDHLTDKNKQVVEKVADYFVLTSTTRLISLQEAALKRFMDICGGLVGLIITGILFLIVAPIIYIQSPGPIFFSQERVGKNGKKFRIYKFRSMYMDAEARKADLLAQNELATTLMFKMEDDPRIIGGKKGIGGIIRRTSIDEFPQFWNVLKGDMSLVGTRPPTVDEWEQYERHHRKRLATKPGITGMWQVSGRSTIEDFEEVVRLDTEYINNWNIGMDIKILLKTVKVLVKREGAA